MFWFSIGVVKLVVEILREQKVCRQIFVLFASKICLHHQTFRKSQRLQLKEKHNKCWNKLNIWMVGNVVVIRCNGVWRANQELVGIHNDAAHEELVKIYNWLTSRKIVIKSIAFCVNEMYPVYKRMLDPIITSYKLTIYLCVTYLEYNNTLWILLTLTLLWRVNSLVKYFKGEKIL